MSLDLCVCGHPLGMHELKASGRCALCDECDHFEPEDEIEASA